MGKGTVVETFSVHFATGRTPFLIGPGPPMFFPLGTGWNAWDLLLPLDQELARECGPPLEELLIAMP
jgi:hypothetical protein